MRLNKKGNPRQVLETVKAIPITTCPPGKGVKVTRMFRFPRRLMNRSKY